MITDQEISQLRIVIGHSNDYFENDILEAMVVCLDHFDEFNLSMIAGYLTKHYKDLLMADIREAINDMYQKGYVILE